MDDNLRRMKANPGDKLVKKSCETCEFILAMFLPGMGSEPTMEMTHMECQWKKQKKCFQMDAKIMVFL